MNYNYKTLILKGWRDQDIKDEKFLYRYFYKKCKEAERDEFIKADEFFEGCFRQIERFEATILKDLGNNEPINERFINFYNDRWLVGEYPFKLYYENINSIKEAMQSALEELKKETLSEPSMWPKKLSTPENEVTDLINEIEQKPIFKPETIETIFDLLKGFFYPIQHDELQELLDTGNNLSEPLIFLSNGNRLADAFKQLIKSDVITGCDQIHLENWILKNFKYFFRGQITDYTPKYLNDIISTTKDKCQKPILNVKLDNSTGKIIIRKA